MTALEKYIRLEAVGQWCEHHGATPQEVIVSFGDNTLQLTTLHDTPVCHWALLATRRIDGDGDVVVYSADPDGDETLSVDDPEMNAAIAAVSAEANHLPERQPILRWLFRLAGVLVVVALLQQTPPLIYNWAATLTPPVRAAQISAVMLDEIKADHGPACRNWQPKRDLEVLTSEIWLTNAPEIIVLETESPVIISLPDGSIVVSIHALQKTPAEFAALLMLQWAMADRDATLEAAIAGLGPVKAIRYFIGGNIAGISAKQALQLTPEAEDFIMARNALDNAQWPTRVLQDMAKSRGIGLPIRAQSTTPFRPDDDIWQSIGQICVNNNGN